MMRGRGDQRFGLSSSSRGGIVGKRRISPSLEKKRKRQRQGFELMGRDVAERGYLREETWLGRAPHHVASRRKTTKLPRGGALGFFRLFFNRQRTYSFL